MSESKPAQEQKPKSLLMIGDEWATRINNYGKAFGVVGGLIAVIGFAGNWLLGQIAANREFVMSLIVLALPYFSNRMLAARIVEWSKSQSQTADNGFFPVLTFTYQAIISNCCVLLFTVGNMAYHVAGTRGDALSSLVAMFGVGYWGLLSFYVMQYIVKEFLMTPIMMSVKLSSHFANQPSKAPTPTTSQESPSTVDSIERQPQML